MNTFTDPVQRFVPDNRAFNSLLYRQTSCYPHDASIEPFGRFRDYSRQYERNRSSLTFTRLLSITSGFIYHQLATRRAHSWSACRANINAIYGSSEYTRSNIRLSNRTNDVSQARRPTKSGRARSPAYTSIIGPKVSGCCSRHKHDSLASSLRVERHQCGLLVHSARERERDINKETSSIFSGARRELIQNQTLLILQYAMRLRCLKMISP